MRLSQLIIRAHVVRLGQVSLQNRPNCFNSSCELLSSAKKSMFMNRIITAYNPAPLSCMGKAEAALK